MFGIEADGSRPEWALPVFHFPHYTSKGVYFLWKDCQLVYIGLSTNVLSRIATHYVDGKCDFTHFTWTDLTNEFEKDPTILAYVEALEIDKWRPVGNRSLDLAVLSRVARELDAMPPPTDEPPRRHRGPADASGRTE